LSTQADLTSTIMVHLATWGVAYVGKFSDGQQITQLACLHPDRVRAELDGGQVRFRYTGPDGQQRLLDERDVVYIRGLSVDGVCALSPVTQAFRVLGLSDQLVRHAMTFFDTPADGATARPAGILKLGGPEYGGDVTEGQIDRTAVEVQNKSRPHGLMVIRGDADYIPIAQKMDDAQFAQQRELSAREVARVMRVPGHMIGAASADSMTYSNVEQESLNFVRYSLQPWLRRIELAFSNDPDLAFQRQYVRFNTDALLRADAATRGEFYTRALDPLTGWATRNEIRALEDMRPEREPTAAQIVQQAVNAATNGATNGN
jgi:HK97 family phage portal protein